MTLPHHRDDFVTKGELQDENGRLRERLQQCLAFAKTGLESENVKDDCLLYIVGVASPDPWPKCQECGAPADWKCARPGCPNPSPSETGEE
jgi:hypothetical protein